MGLYGFGQGTGHRMCWEFALVDGTDDFPPPLHAHLPRQRIATGHVFDQRRFDVECTKGKESPSGGGGHEEAAQIGVEIVLLDQLDAVFTVIGRVCGSGGRGGGGEMARPRSGVGSMR